MARPKIEIDWKKVDNFLKAQCDGAAIAGILGIHPDTLYKACEVAHKMGFSAYAALKKSEGRELLRAKMYEEAFKGDKTMLVWLSKQYLGFSDTQKIDHTTDGQPIKFTGFSFLDPIAKAPGEDGE